MSLEVQAPAGSTDARMYRRDKTGEIVLVDAPPREFYVDPQAGEYEILQVTGISEVFQRPASPEYRKEGDPEMQELRCWEITVRKGKNLNGRTFGVVMTDKYGAGQQEANAARIIRGIRGRAIDKHETISLGDYIGNVTDKRGVFCGIVGKSSGGRPKIVDVIVSTKPVQTTIETPVHSGPAEGTPSVFDQPDEDWDADAIGG